MAAFPKISQCLKKKQMIDSCRKTIPTSPCHLNKNFIKSSHFEPPSKLVGGFNPFEKYESNWESFAGRGENQQYLQPPPRQPCRILPFFQWVPTCVSCCESDMGPLAGAPDASSMNIAAPVTAGVKIASD